MRIPGRRWWASSATIVLVATIFSLPAARADSDRTAWLGVYTQSLTPELREALGHEGDGVLVNRVVSQSPADRAGIRKGDLIARFDGQSVNSPSDLARAVQSHRVGDDVAVMIVRDGDRLKLRASLAGRGDEEDLAPPAKDKDDDGEKGDDDWADKDHDAPKAETHEFHFDMPVPPDAPEAPDAPMTIDANRARLGVRIESLNPELGDYFDVKDGRGVLVLDVIKGSAAEHVGLKPGDVIVQVGDRDVNDSDDLVRAIGESDGKTEVTIVRHGSRRTFEPELSASNFGPKVLRIRRGDGPWRSFDGNRWRTGTSRVQPSDRDKADMERELKALKDEIRELKEDLKSMDKDRDKDGDDEEDEDDGR